jgi:hypothetical protein
MSRSDVQEHRSVAGYSSKVQLFLEMLGRVYSLSEIDPDFVTLREPADLPPGNADVVMRVDGSEQRWPVELPHGAAAVPFDLTVATIDR